MRPSTKPTLFLLLGVLTCLLLAACGGGGGSGGAADTPQPPAQPQSLFTIVSDAQWDDTAVRQVLHTFAFGSHATDAQIKAWADMSPRQAIDQMLVLAPTAPLLSPPESTDAIAQHNGSLEALAAHFASDDALNRIDTPFRKFFRTDNPGQGTAPDLTWSYASALYGVNPLRMRLGFYETNYHMAVHQLLGNVDDAEMLRYFDDITNGLARGDSYDQVLATAALSAAIASQYGHYKNVYINGQFFGNEDFAREFHQLFFGIFGVADPQQHEAVTIKNTAHALSGIQLTLDGNGRPLPNATYSTALHDPHDLTILGATISGTNANDAIRSLARVAIVNSESQDNLPVLLIRGLADDNLDDATIAELRRGWRAMASKDLLRFLRDYAISPLFHSNKRVKRLNSFERTLLAVNLTALRNAEVFTDLYNVRGFTDEGADPFKPANNVFGGQRGTDAAASSAVFRAAMNRSVEQWIRNVIPNYDQPLVGPQEKDWRTAIPRGTDGKYRAGDVARWLWQRYIADGLDHYGALEEAQLLSLITNGVDFGTIGSGGATPDRVYTAAEISSTPALTNLISQLRSQELQIDASDLAARRIGNALIGQGVNFVTATPWFFVLQGRSA